MIWIKWKLSYGAEHGSLALLQSEMLEFDRKTHWEAVYSSRPVTETSWHQKDPRFSLSLIENAGVGTEAALIDVGGGASLLVDYLLESGYRDLTVLDISAAALEQARQRLGQAADQVNWIESDITVFRPQRQFELWHDRAVFHFLTDGQDRDSYVRVMNTALKVGGQAIIAAFALDGPKKCSGLDVVRYDRESLQSELGERFECLEADREEHETPAGRRQMFGFYRFRKIS